MHNATLLLRRRALEWLGTATAGLSCWPPAAAAAAATIPGASALPPHNLLWKTAMGLNGFESPSRSYKKRHPLREIPDPYNAAAKAKQAMDEGTR